MLRGVDSMSLAGLSFISCYLIIITRYVYYRLDRPIH